VDDSIIVGSGISGGNPREGCVAKQSIGFIDITVITGDDERSRLRPMYVLSIERSKPNEQKAESERCRYDKILVVLSAPAFIQE
jgi:hypothetical protein